MQTAPFKSDFAILDVKEGRRGLAAQINAGFKQRVLIEMEIDTQHSADDGTSIEFSGSVKSVKLYAR